MLVTHQGVASTISLAILATMNSIATLTNPAPAPIAKPKQQRATKISKQLRSALEAMVWQGLKRDEAAQLAGMKDNSLYVALRRPDVKAAYLAECEVLRVSGRARRIHRLEAMLEQDDNKAAVINAALALDRVADQEVTGRAAALPGLQIVIVQHGNAPPAMTIEHSETASLNPSD